MIYLLTIFIISWLIFIIFADKRMIHDFSSTCYLAIILGLLTDILVSFYPLWEYSSNSSSGKIIISLLNDFGIYIVVVYLFIQNLPKNQTAISMIKYIFFWSIFALCVEISVLKVEAMKYGLWWNLGCSYAADCILYLLFYEHYKFMQNIKNNHQHAK